MLGDLNALKTFRAILGTGSLTSAARELGASLAVVSKRLQALERRTGVRLINRTTRALSPTEAEGRLLRNVEQALDALAAASRQERCVSVRRLPWREGISRPFSAR